MFEFILTNLHNISLFILSKESLMAFFNLLFVASLICFGGVMGSYSRGCRDSQNKASKDNSGNDNKRVSVYRFGIASAFICVPFISSFLHVDYSSIIFPVADGGGTKFIEQILLLVSVSGISAYLGYALLDGLANKVLKQQVDDIDKKQQDLEAEQDEFKDELDKSKDLIEQLEMDKKITKFELGYFKAISAVDKAESMMSNLDEALSVKKKLTEALDAVTESLSLVKRNDVPKDDYDKLLVLKAYILKRLDRIDDALSITDELLVNNETNPILIYNKACYQYILRRCQADNSDIKEMIRRALTIKVTDPEFIRRQEKIRAKVIGNKDNDLAGLFSSDELEALKVAIK